MSKTTSEVIHEMAQECLGCAPVIVLGSGASCAYGIPGMQQLREHILRISTASMTPEQQRSWTAFIEVLKVKDLETALNEVRLPDTLTKLIVENTWDFLTPFDVKVFDELLADRSLFPLSKVYQHIFKSTVKLINVITPNYDRLAEYAADAVGLHHYTGFSCGFLRTRVTGVVPKLITGNAQCRTVNIWKVHGSFDWFCDKDGIVMALPVMGRRPVNALPVIVTPGIEKYRLTHDEPFHSIKTEADKALHAAESYLCIGYGFNDPHLQTTLVERCREKLVPLVLITKTISSTAHEFLRSGKCGRYLAIEESSLGSRVYTSDDPNGTDIVGDFWKLDKFLTLVI